MQFLSPGQALADYTKMDPHPFPDSVDFNWSPQGIIATCDLSGRNIEATESDCELATQALAVRIMREAFQQDAQDLFNYFKDRYLSGTFPATHPSCVLSEVDTALIVALKRKEYLSSMTSRYESPHHQPHVAANHQPPLPSAQPQGGAAKPPLPPCQVDQNRNLRMKPSPSGSQIMQLPGSLANSFVRAGETSKSIFVPDHVQANITKARDYLSLAKTQVPDHSSVSPAAAVSRLSSDQIDLVTTRRMKDFEPPSKKRSSKNARKRGKAADEFERKGQDGFSTGANTIPLKQRKFPVADDSEPTLSSVKGTPIPSNPFLVIGKEVKEDIEPYFVNFGASENEKTVDEHLSPIKKSSFPVCDEEDSPVVVEHEESDFDSSYDSGVDDPTLSVVFNNLKSEDPLRVCLAMSIQDDLLFKINSLRAREEMFLNIKESNVALFEKLVMLRSRYSEINEAASTCDSATMAKWKEICRLEKIMMNQASPPIEIPCTEAYLHKLMARIEHNGKIDFVTTKWDKGRLFYVTLRPQNAVAGRGCITFCGKGMSSLEASIHACCAALDFLSREAVFGFLVAPSEGNMSNRTMSNRLTALEKSSDGRNALLACRQEGKFVNFGFYRFNNKVDTLESVATEEDEARTQLNLRILRKYGGILHYNDYESQTLTQVPLLKKYRFAAPFEKS